MRCAARRTSAASRRPRRRCDDGSVQDDRRTEATARSRSTCPPATAGPASCRQGELLRIVDLHGNQAVDTLFFDAHDYANRYSAVDTLREQGSVYLRLGSRCWRSTAARW